VKSFTRYSLNRWVLDRFVLYKIRYRKLPLFLLPHTKQLFLFVVFIEVV